jgi:MFS family permease
VFGAAALAGFASSYCLGLTPEPAMAPAPRRASLRALLRMPMRDPGFRGLLVLLAAWNLATNLAAPILAVYLMEQLHYSLGTVTTLRTSQLPNALTLYLWGRVSDRLSNKAVLAVALPAYFVCTLGLVFAGLGSPDVQLPLLYIVHALMGAASGGIGLATGNLSLKLAPREQGTA